MGENGGVKQKKGGSALNPHPGPKHEINNKAIANNIARKGSTEENLLMTPFSWCMLPLNCMQLNYSSLILNDDSC